MSSPTGADTVVLFLGLPASAESEGFDRTDIDLPPVQLELVRQVSEVSDRVVVVLANGSVVRTSTWEDSVSAVLECWLGGQAAGGAVADLLTGAANPSGKLAETIPVRLEDNPSYLNFPGDSQLVRYGEGLFIGYRAYDALDLAGQPSLRLRALLHLLRRRRSRGVGHRVRRGRRSPRRRSPVR